MYPRTHIERITLSDSAQSAITKLADRNPGALSVLCQLFTESGALDPLAFGSGFAALLNLDSFGIYGPRIGMLYKDVCGTDLARTVFLLRACQLGLVSRAALNMAIDCDGEGIDAAALARQAMNQLYPDGIEAELPDAPTASE
jgi:hypothetical protein